jgi:hypothetical protein
MRFLLDLISLRSARPSDWAERNAGRAIALCVGVIAFSWLAVTTVAIPVRRDPPPMIRIILESVKTAGAMPELDEVAATSVNPSETAVSPMTIEQMIRDAQPDSRPSVRNWQPRDEAEKAKLEEILLQVANHSDRLNVRETNLKAEVQRVQIETIGREFLVNSDGGRAGLIRTIDVDDFPEHIVRPVLNRFGISVENKYVNPANNPSGRYLNAVTTREGVYTTQTSPGYYETFVVSAKAMALLAAIETKALMDRGFDPKFTRIRKITFGIVMDAGNEYTLGVTDIQVERLR